VDLYAGSELLKAPRIAYPQKKQLVGANRVLFR
jgi:hypothetical protein